jgi:predicted acetyltransferase
MSYYLKRINESMGSPEYEMFQEIPENENDSKNLAFGINFEDFKKFLKSQFDRKNAKLNYKQTPTLCYIFYKNELPIGEICVRTKLNQHWREHSGNVFYTIRPTQRGKGYGKIMLKLALEKCKKLGMKSALLQCNIKNILSKIVIESCDGELTKNDGYSFFYKINL